MKHSLVQNIFTILSFFFLLSCSLVFSQLSSNQTSTMIKLSQLLNSSVPSWDVNKEPNPCLWKGVTCINNSITVISLSGLDISSSDFLPVVCQLGSLQLLDVSNNQLSSIPNDFLQRCGGIDGLKQLNFSNNRLVHSLPTFNGFVGLQFLDLSGNQLNGSISLQFDELVSLKSLNLSRNFLSGLLPISLGKSKALEKLELSLNVFHGEIPESIADYGNLTLIDLGANHLSGSVPDRIGELSKLEVLILSANYLNGRIPTSLANIATLSRFAANQNNFSGSIPLGITRFLRNLDLSYNKLTGGIPLDLLSHPNLQSLDLSFNSLDGSIPENISSSLVRLRLGSNLLTGVIPSASFVSLEKLTYLELDNNSFTGIIPQQLGNCQNLALLNLAQNRLNGSLPIELGSLGNLQVMKLQLNKLSGEITSQFSQLKMLSTMNISWNSLSGSIPSLISSLPRLENLYLQHNDLRGSIPNSVTDMRSLIELQLGENQLSGPIPVMPSSLHIALNLSSNLFEGHIPTTLSRLTGLEVLDLSNNNFSGEIPETLIQMSALTQLILSNNQLSGVIPKFGSWVLVSTTGNPELINATVPDTSARPAERRKSVVVPILIALAAAILAIGVVTIIALSIPKHFYRVKDEHLQLREGISSPHVIQGNLLTQNGIHRSNIDFTKAMEAVVNPLNIELTTRFSTYYKAIMPSGMSYFIKKLNWSDKISQLGSHDKFDKDLEILGKLSNSNVMMPLAYMLASDGAYLFYEYAPKGTIFDVLHGSLENALDWASRYSIAVGVAQGLAFLHGYTSNPIILLDLSSRNILLKSLKEPIIGDIELCKVIDPSNSTSSSSISTVSGSIEYTDMTRVTMARNVYSFGVILLELLTGKAAVREGNELANWVLQNSAQQDKLDQILDFNVSGTSLAVKSQMLAVLEVAVTCVNASPEARPKINSVLRMLL